MPGGLAAALAGIGLLGAVQTTPFVAARAEVDAGVAPKEPQAPSKPSMLVDLRPAAGARLATARSTLDLAILPRLYLQWPNPTNQERPLILVRSDLTHRYEMSQRLVWLSYLGVFAGEVNYTSTPLLFNSALQRNLNQAVITAANVEGRSGFTWQTSNRTALTFIGLGQFTAPLTEASKISLPQTTLIGFEIANGWQTTPDTRLSFPLRARRYFVKGAADSVTLETGVDHHLTLSERSAFDTSLGLAYGDTEGQDARFLPTGSIAYERMIYQTRAANVTNRIMAQVTTAYDPTRSLVYPIGGISAVVGGQVGTSWRPYAAVDAYTTLTNGSITGTPPTPPGNATAAGNAQPLKSTDTRFSAVAALGYRLTQEFTFEFGTRVSTWAPNFRDKFELVDYQVFGFVALTFALDLPTGGPPGTTTMGGTGMMGGSVMNTQAPGGTQGGIGSGGR